jgi:hypothetical protein
MQPVQDIIDQPEPQNKKHTAKLKNVVEKKAKYSTKTLV